MQRETKKIQLPSGAIMTANTYLTAGESNAIKAVMMAAMRIDIADLKAGMTETPLKGQIDGTILMEQEKLLIQFLIVDAPFDDVMSLRAADYEVLVSELNAIKSGPLAPAK